MLLSAPLTLLDSVLNESIYTCVLVVSWITAFLKFSLESLLPIALDFL